MLVLLQNLTLTEMLALQYNWKEWWERPNQLPSENNIGKEITMRFFKVGDQYINLDNIASIAESARGYVIYWTDHNGKGKQTDFTKDSNEGKALAQFLQSN